MTAWGRNASRGTGFQPVPAQLGKLCHGWRLNSDARGQVTIEWALVMVVVALPMYFVFKVLLSTLVAHFQMVSLIETIPIP